MVDRSSRDASFDTKADAPALKNARLALGSSTTVNMITFMPGVHARNLATRLQGVDVREVHVEHDHVRLEPLRRLQQQAAIRDTAYDVAVQCQQPGDGFHHVRVVVRNQHAGTRGQR